MKLGMPELSKMQDINYLKDKLAMHLTDQEAINVFSNEIREALNSTYRRIDNFIHGIKRAG